MSTTREELVIRPFVFHKVSLITQNNIIQQNYFITLFIFGHNFLKHISPPGLKFLKYFCEFKKEKKKALQRRNLKETLFIFSALLPRILNVVL